MFSHKVQSFIEYVVLLVVVVSGLLIGMVYVKKSNQGRLKISADSVSGGVIFSYTHSNRKEYIQKIYGEHSEEGVQWIEPDTVITKLRILFSPEITSSIYNDNFSGVSLREENLWE